MHASKHSSLYQALFHLFLLDSSFPLDIFPIDINIHPYVLSNQNRANQAEKFLSFFDKKLLTNINHHVITYLSTNDKYLFFFEVHEQNN